MKTPKWLTNEVEELGKGVFFDEIPREEAIDTITDHVFEKDEPFARSLVSGFVAGKIQAWLNARKRGAVDRVQQIVIGQAGFDEICSDYWSRDTFGPLTPLEELEKYHEQMCRMTDGFSRRDDERGERLRELIKAAGGDKTVGWEEAERRRLGIARGDTAAEG